MRKTIELKSLFGHIGGLFTALVHVFVLAFALEIFAITSPFYLQWVIDNVLIASDVGLLALLAIGFALLLVMQSVASAARSWLVVYFGASLNVQWRANVFGHLLRLPGSYFERRHVGDTVSRFSSIDAIQHTLTTSFIEALLDGLMTIVTLTVMFLYSAKLSLLTVGAVTLYVVGRLAWYMPLRNATNEQIIYAAKQQSYFLETIRAIRPIKIAVRFSQRRDSWISALVDQLNAEVRAQKLIIIFKFGNSLVFGLENVIVIWLGAHAVLSGQFTVGMLMAFLAYKGALSGRVTSLVDRSIEFKMLRLHAERLADIVLTDYEEAARDAPSFNTARDCLPATIDFHNVSFRYGEHEPLVLKGLHLSVAAGECVALTGPSGGGKSTLIDLLLGLLTPSEGEVLIGGVALQQLGLDTVRTMTGAILQDDSLVEGSVADNISFFEDNVDMSWVEHCARLAAIHDEITAMPMGYRTQVGFLGSTLSGGQKQRVLLARALYRKPQILVLDEATSHLDVPLELVVSAALRSLRITRLVVAHRPQTIESADRVVTLAAGMIAVQPSVA